jgi:hypothetical protein
LIDLTNQDGTLGDILEVPWSGFGLVGIKDDSISKVGTFCLRHDVEGWSLTEG